LSYESFIARKILSGKSGKRPLLNPVIRVAVIGITLGMAVMITAVMVVTGFRNEITNKVIGFGAHIRINNFDSNNSYEEVPIDTRAKFVHKLKSNPSISHIQQYATKAGIIKTDEEIQGIVLKGIGRDYNLEYFKSKMISGKALQPGDSSASNEVMISRKTSLKLGLKAGDNMIVYFIEQPPRIRKFVISGIYETGLDEFDNLYVFCDINVIRKLNGWSEQQAGGFELYLKDYRQLDTMNEYVYHAAGYQFYTQSIKEQYPQIFNWLDLQNINVIIIITLILLVCGISMISTLLIIILENSTLIGVLKALGANDKSIRRIFIYVSIPVIGSGIVAGNIIAIVLCFLQLHFGFITLPQESYYVSQVPVNFSFSHLLLLNAGTLLACIIMLIGPSMVVSRIRPSSVIRFD
jgi:lipoprotein-releasing system permease protein